MTSRFNEIELIARAQQHRDEAGLAAAAGDSRKARELDRLASHAEAMAERALQRYFEPAV